jgi:LPS-assembly lipoprotein
MSSPDSGPACASTSRQPAGRRAWLGVCLAMSLAALVGCGDSGFRPLYAPGASGETASEKLKDVDFALIPGRVGQRIRNDLIFESTGGGHAKGTPPQFRLEVVLRESVLSTLVDIKGQVAGSVYAVEASFRLIDAKAKKVVFQGTSHARAPFERFESIYSNVRAREDAENRAARTIADDLKTRLAAYLSRSV